jgi:mRNA interferase MazF
VPQPGEIVVVDFPGVHGVKRRPAIVLSSDVYHRNRPDVILGLITSQIASATGPTDYVLQDGRIAGLHTASAFRAFLVTLPQAAITASIGRASDRDWREILTCVETAIAK